MEHIRKLPMRALKFFYFVAHYGSMSLAANKLCVTHGAVSKQLKNLETHLGVSLFIRRGRELVLTPAGRRLQHCCQPLFHDLETTLSQLSWQPDKTLIVSCEPTIAMKWLIPRTADFNKATNIDVVILAAGGVVDFARQNIDVAIRRNDFVWSPSINSYYLVDEEIGAVQSPQASQVSRGSHLIRLHTHSRADAWQDWLALRDISPVVSDDVIDDPRAGLEEMYFEHFYLSIQAAIAGLGQAIASRLMVQDDLATGLLTAPQGFAKDGSAYYLLSESPIANHEKKQVFLHWLKSQMSDNLG